MQLRPRYISLHSNPRQRTSLNAGRNPLIGIVSFEVFGHLTVVLADRDELFDSRPPRSGVPFR